MRGFSVVSRSVWILLAIAQTSFFLRTSSTSSNFGYNSKIEKLKPLSVSGVTTFKFGGQQYALSSEEIQPVYEELILRNDRPSEELILMTDFLSNMIWSLSSTILVPKLEVSLVRFGGDGNADTYKLSKSVELSDATFPGPVGIATRKIANGNQEIFVASYSADAIQRIFESTQQKEKKGVSSILMVESLQIEVVGVHGALKKPSNLAIDNRGGKLFVVDTYNHLIRVINLTTMKMADLENSSQFFKGFDTNLLGFGFGPKILLRDENQFSIVDSHEFTHYSFSDGFEYDPNENYAGVLSKIIQTKFSRTHRLKNLLDFVLNDDFIRTSSNSNLYKDVHAQHPMIRFLLSNARTSKIENKNKFYFIHSSSTPASSTYSSYMLPSLHFSISSPTISLLSSSGTFPGVAIFPIAYQRGDNIRHITNSQLQYNILSKIEFETYRHSNSEIWRFFSPVYGKKSFECLMFLGKANSLEIVRTSGDCIYQLNVGVLFVLSNIIDESEGYIVKLDQDVFENLLLKREDAKMDSQFYRSMKLLPSAEKGTHSNMIANDDLLISENSIEFVVVHISVPDAIQLRTWHITKDCESNDVIMFDVSRSAVVRFLSPSNLAITQRWKSVSVNVSSISLLQLSNETALLKSATSLENFLSKNLDPSLPCFIPLSILEADTQYSIAITLCDLDSGKCGSDTVFVNVTSPNKTNIVLPPRALIAGSSIRSMDKSSDLTMTTIEFFTMSDVLKLGGKYLGPYIDEKFISNCSSSTSSFKYLWTLELLDDSSYSSSDDEVSDDDHKTFVGGNDNDNGEDDGDENATDEDDDGYLVDTSLMTSMEKYFTVKGAMLAAGNIYLITLVVEDTKSGLKSYDYNILEALPTPLYVEILPAENQVLPLNDTLILNGTHTTDPDAIFTDLNSLIFYWSCQAISPSEFADPDACPLVLVRRNTTSNDDEDNVSGDPSYSWSTEWKAENCSSVNQTALISLIVTDKFTGRTGSQSIIVTVVDDDDPIINITYDDDVETKFNVNNQLAVMGTVKLPSESSKPCTAVWSESSNKLSLSDVATMKISSAVTSKASTYSLPLSLRSSALKAGESYAFVLSCGSTSRNVVTVSTNSPPRNGVFRVSPLEGGIELLTWFSIAALQWFDEDIPITYQFGYIPVVSIRSSQSQTVVFRSRSEQNFDSTMLPKGQLTGFDSSSSLLNVTCSVFDALNAERGNLIQTVNITIDDTKSQAEKEKLIYDTLKTTMSTSSNSEIMQFIAVATEIINEVNCSSISSGFCNTLHRDGCSLVPHTCGECWDGYIGEDGHRNTMCVGSLVTSASSKNIGKLNSYSPLYMQLSSISKRCPGSCSGHGRCSFYHLGSGGNISSCSLTSTNCEARCHCDNGYQEDAYACSRPDADIIRQREIRALMLSGTQTKMDLAKVDGKIDETEWSNLWNLLVRIIRYDSPSDLVGNDDVGAVITLSSIIHSWTTLLSSATISTYSDAVRIAATPQIESLIDAVFAVSGYNMTAISDDIDYSLISIVSTNLESLETVLEIALSSTIANDNSSSNEVIGNSLRSINRVASESLVTPISIPLTNIESVVQEVFPSSILHPVVTGVNTSNSLEMSVLQLTVIDIESVRNELDDSIANLTVSDLVWLRTNDHVESVSFKVPVEASFSYPTAILHQFDCADGDKSSVFEASCPSGPIQVLCSQNRGKHVNVTCGMSLIVPTCLPLSTNLSKNGTKSLVNCDAISYSDDYVECLCENLPQRVGNKIPRHSLSHLSRSLIALDSITVHNLKLIVRLSEETIDTKVSVSATKVAALDDSARQRSVLIVALFFVMLWFFTGLFVMAKWKKTKSDLADPNNLRKELSSSALGRRKSKKYDVPGTFAHAKKKQSSVVAPIPISDGSASNPSATVLSYQQQQRLVMAEKERTRTIMLDTLMAYFTAVLPAVYTYGFRPADYDPRRRAIGLPPRGRRRRLPVTSSWSMNMMIHELIKNHRWFNLVFTSATSASGIGSRTSACTCRPWMTITFELLTYQTVTMFLIGLLLDFTEYTDNVFSSSTPIGATLASTSFFLAFLAPPISWLFIIIASPTEEEVKLAMNPRTRYITGGTTSTGAGTAVKRGKTEQEKLFSDTTVVKRETWIGKLVSMLNYVMLRLHQSVTGTTSTELVPVVNYHQPVTAFPELAQSAVEMRVVTFLPAETIYAQRLMRQASQSLLPLLQQWVRQRLQKDKDRERERDRLIILKRHERGENAEAGIGTMSLSQAELERGTSETEGTKRNSQKDSSSSNLNSSLAVKEIEELLVLQHQSLLDNTVSISSLGPTAAGIAPNTTAGSAVSSSSKIMSAMLMNDDFSRFCDQWQVDPQSGHFVSPWTKSRVQTFLEETGRKKEQSLKELRQVMGQRESASVSVEAGNNGAPSKALGFTGIAILQQFVHDLLGGPHSTTARIFMAKVNEDFGQTLPLVKTWMRVLAILIVLLLNVFFVYYTVAKGYSRPSGWETKFVVMCAAQLFLDLAFYEVVQCLWIHVLVPGLVAKELRQVQCLLQEVAFQIVAMTASLETVAEEEEEDLEEEEESNMKKVAIKPFEKKSDEIREPEREGRDKKKTVEKEKDIDKEKGSPNAKKRKGLILNAPDFVFVSTQIAKSFPDLLESILVLVYQTYLPGEELSKFWRDNKSNGSSHTAPLHNGSGSDREAVRQRYKAANSLFAPFLTVIGFLVTYILIPVVAFLSTDVQKVVLRVGLSLFFYGCWYLYKVIVGHPLTMAVTLLLIVIIIALIIYKILVIDQQRLESLVNNVAPLPMVTGVVGGRRGSAFSTASGGGGIQSRRVSLSSTGANGEINYVQGTTTPKNRSRSETQTLTIDLTIPDGRVMSFDDYDNESSALAMALTLHPPTGQPATQFSSPHLGSGQHKGFFSESRRFSAPTTSATGMNISPPRSGRNSRIEDTLYTLQPNGDVHDDHHQHESDDDHHHHDSDDGYEDHHHSDDDDDENYVKHHRIHGDSDDSDNEQYGQVTVRYPVRVTNL